MISWSIEAVSFGNCYCDYGCPCQFGLVRRLLTTAPDSIHVGGGFDPKFSTAFEVGASRAVCFSRGCCSDRSPGFDSQITRQNRFLRESGQPRWAALLQRVGFQRRSGDSQIEAFPGGSRDDTGRVEAAI
jgi:hypothetical protein